MSQLICFTSLLVIIREIIFTLVVEKVSLITHSIILHVKYHHSVIHQSIPKIIIQKYYF